MSSTTALITGITGQDGTYLSELLREKGYRVAGMVQSLAGSKTDAVRKLLPFVEMVEGDLGDLASLVKALERMQPDEVYNLGALSSVSRSWSQPELTAEITGLGTLRLLEAIRLAGLAGTTRFYQASSSEMFGQAQMSPQNENTPFAPIHPYAVAKVFAHHTTANFRQAHGLYAVCGILFNHESPRRGEEFVTRKITRGVARIALGRQDRLALGNLDVRRDWGYAPEYVEAMWKMLQQPEPDDFVIATGITHSVREFLDSAFRHAGISDWEGLVDTDPSLARPADIEELCGDASKAREVLDWNPHTEFEELVGIMVDADTEREKAAPNPTGDQ
jgi:GDPmannose 4,6-dehydratase